MIPADVASRLRPLTQDVPAPPQPAAATAKLTDVLSDLVPGQRLMAEVQALLPNGTYRAMIAQRDVTLALPFSAKPGDSLELEVVESDGKLTLAFVANRNPAAQTAPSESVSATLSRTGQLIGDLLGNIDEQGKKPAPLALNGNQPLIDEFPTDAGELAPILKEALSKSGMFYEAHQARWAEGNLPTAALLQEPQGKLSPTLHDQHGPEHARQSAVQSQNSDLGVTAGNQQAKDLGATSANPESASTQKSPSANPIPLDLAPVVRQQLDALATQTYVWQGQVWPGQQMHWEIQKEPEGRRQAPNDSPPGQWQTRLQLNLPGLGGIDAVIRLRPGGTVDLTVLTDSEQSRHTLASAGEGLRQQLDNAGLNLTALVVRHEQTAG